MLNVFRHFTVLKINFYKQFSDENNEKVFRIFFDKCQEENFWKVALDSEKQNGKLEPFSCQPSKSLSRKLPLQLLGRNKNARNVRMLLLSYMITIFCQNQKFSPTARQK